MVHQIWDQEGIFPHAKLVTAIVGKRRLLSSVAWGLASSLGFSGLSLFSKYAAVAGGQGISGALGLSYSDHSVGGMLCFLRLGYGILLKSLSLL